MLDMGIEAAEIAIAFHAAFAQRGDGACLHQLEKVKARGGTDVWTSCGAETSDPSLHGRYVRRCVR